MSFNENARRIGTHPFSYSKLEVAKTCGFQFAKRYIERVKPTDPKYSAAATVGTAVHLILELGLKKFMLEAIMPTPAEINHAVDQIFGDIVTAPGSKITSSEKDQITLLLGNTTKLLTQILSYVIATKSKVFLEEELAIDRNFNPVAFGDPLAFFRGKLDLILVAPNGAVRVIDHKTNQVNEWQSRQSILEKHREQLLAYDILVYYGMRARIKDELGIEVKAIWSGLSYVVLGDILETPAPTKTGDLKVATTQWFINWVNSLSDRATEGKVTRAKHCEWCGYQSLCGSKRGKNKKQKPVAL